MSGAIEPAGLPVAALGKSLTLARSPFGGLLSDAVRFALLAKGEPEGSEDESLFVRSSIVHSAFAVEAAANGCMKHLPLTSRLLDSLDKLSTIDKFDLAASYFQRDARLDRGCRSVQLVSDLLTQRNLYVHSKWTRKEMTHVESDGEGHAFEVDATVSPALGWSDDRTSWRRAEAAQALRAVRDFLHYVFVELCPLDVTSIDRILADHIEGEQTVTTMLSPHLAAMVERARIELGCDFRFLGCVSRA